MAKTVKCAHIQVSCPPIDEYLKTENIAAVKKVALEKHLPFIDKAGKEKVNILCLTELFFGPYFCAEQNTRWFALAETIPGPTTLLLQTYAKKYKMVIIAPIFEEDAPGIYYNTAIVIDADGSYLGKMRKIHIPHAGSGYWEKFYFRPGNLGFPLFNTAYAKIGVYICYDRHYPEFSRILALKGAEILFSPCAAATCETKSMWEDELDNQTWARLNGVFIGGNNRVGIESPWNFGHFYGSSYFVDPYGEFIVRGSRDKNEIVTADLNLTEIKKARINWPLFRDRRPETYGELCQ